jgi:hypothetical protein
MMTYVLPRHDRNRSDHQRVAEPLTFYFPQATHGILNPQKNSQKTTPPVISLVDTGDTSGIFPEQLPVEGGRMRVLALLFFLLIAGCGDTYDACKDVDTSQAPKSITTSGNSSTYYWGNGCSRTYPTGSARP